MNFTTKQIVILAPFLTILLCVLLVCVAVASPVIVMYFIFKLLIDLRYDLKMGKAKSKKSNNNKISFSDEFWNERD